MDQQRKYVDELENAIDSYQHALKDCRNELELLEIKLKHKEKEIFDAKNHRNEKNRIDELENRLQTELDTRNRLKIDLQEKTERIAQLERATCNRNPVDDLEDLVALLSKKDARILELESALRESVEISRDREVVLQQEEAKRKKIIEKVMFVA